MTTSITIDGAACKFSAAHVLAGHPKCGRLHGHNYHVGATFTGDVDAAGMVLDFAVLKQALQDAIEPLDHRLLLPALAFDGKPLDNYAKERTRKGNLI